MVELLREQEKAVPATALGIYLHVPFCASTCDFCGFYQTRPRGNAFADFVQDVRRELALISLDCPVETVFWGGGTPGLLPARQILELGAVFREALGAGTPREWSVEMAPASVDAARLQAMRDIGVTRISLGVQSFDPELLDALGRRHTREQVLRAYDLIRRVGFPSVNLDLIFAIPGQDRTCWRSDLKAAVDLHPDHLSTYCLTFEEDTALFVKLARGQVSIDPEREASFYEAAWGDLAEAGYAQYEISNFARPGHQCLHNLNTWRMQSWVGLGPAAASQHGGWRGTNPPDLDRWAQLVSEGRRATEDRRALTDALLAEDSLIFGMRLNEGVSLQELAGRFPGAPWESLEPLWERLESEGLLERPSPERIRLTPHGRLVCDAVGAEIMAADGE